MSSSPEQNNRTETSDQGASHAHIGNARRKGWETMSLMQPPIKQVVTVGPAVAPHTRTTTESQSTHVLSVIQDADQSALPQRPPAAVQHQPSMPQSPTLRVQHQPAVSQSPPLRVTREANQSVLPQSPPPLADFISEAVPTNQVVADPTVEDPQEAANPEADSSGGEDDDDVIDVDALPDEIRHDGPSSRTRAASDPVKAAEKAREQAELEQASQACLSSAPATASNGDPIPPGKIILTVRDMNDYTVEYLIRPTCPLSTMFENFLVHHIRMRRNEVRFSFDGARLCDTDTAAGKGMLSGDSIDCFWSLSGGHRRL